MKLHRMGATALAAALVLGTASCDDRSDEMQSTVAPALLSEKLEAIAQKEAYGEQTESPVGLAEPPTGVGGGPRTDAGGDGQ